MFLFPKHGLAGQQEKKAKQSYKHYIILMHITKNSFHFEYCILFLLIQTVNFA